MNKIVEGTNDSSITSKYSMIMAGYDKDPYMKYFVHKIVKRAPLINQVYFVRWVAITQLIKHFCSNTRDLFVQIVSLGAGFDTTYFRTISEYNNFKYFEIDLPRVVKNKVEIVKQCEELMRLIAIQKENVTFGDDNEYLMSQNYTIFSHDLNTLDGLEMKLTKFGFEFDTPTLVLSECSLTYLGQEKCTSLINWIQRKFTRSIFAAYEQVYPDDAFGNVMTSHFKKIQSPLKSVHTYKTIHLQIQRFLSCGWHWCKGALSDRLLSKISNDTIPYYITILGKEPFDEFEEWYLANCHYALIVATKQEFECLWDEWLPDFLHIPNSKGKNELKVKWKSESKIKLERFGHTCLSTSDNTFLVIGGFGNENKKHGRMKIVHHVSLENTSLDTIQIRDEQNGKESPRWDCMYSTCTKINDSLFVLYGGRTSPQNPVNTKAWLCTFKWCDVTKCGNIIPIAQGSSNAEMHPCPRWRHTAALISPGKIIICGGLTIQNNKQMQPLFDAWLLTILSTDRETQLIWTQLPNISLNGIFSHSAAVHNDIMYITGGLDTYLKPITSVYTFHLSENWKEINFNPLLKPRFGHTSHVTDNNQLLLVGGVNGYPEDQPGLAVICLKSRTVVEYNLWPISPEYPMFMAHNHISIFRKKDNCLYIAGGGGNCFSFGTYFNPSVVSICIASKET